MLRLCYARRAVCRAVVALLPLLGAIAHAEDAALTALLQPYDGPTLAAGDSVDRTTLAGKVICGYQGWFAAEGDGLGRGFYHYQSQGRFEPGHCSIDLWPDMRELDAAERYATPFVHADGTTATVFSAQNAATVDRHFRWMREYGIDGVMVQRFAGEVAHPEGLLQFTRVLSHCRAAANRRGRAYAVMYDLSTHQPGITAHVIEDWKRLVDGMRLGRDDGDAAYLRHEGRPLVGVWGVGLNDNRPYTLAECAQLIEFLKHDPVYGGNAVLLGAPYGWRTLDRDSVADPELHRVLKLADILSPWTIGRYRTPEEVRNDALPRWRADAAWCRAEGLSYLPVVFPGFSWKNMFPATPQPMIARLGGRFLESQFAAVHEAGLNAAYVAMFDEMDEGTAIFKCTNDPPVGASTFLTYEGLPSDHYLKLVGEGGRLLRGDTAAR